MIQLLRSLKQDLFRVMLFLAIVTEYIEKPKIILKVPNVNIS